MITFQTTAKKILTLVTVAASSRTIKNILQDGNSGLTLDGKSGDALGGSAVTVSF